MGMDLCLYPCEKGHGCNEFSEEWLRGEAGGHDILGYSRLSFDRNYDLFDQIEGFDRGNTRQVVVPCYEIPPNTTLGVYHDEGLEKRETTPYGDRLTFAWGRDMKKITAGEDETAWNKAILAFIQAMPDDALYILYWR